MLTRAQKEAEVAELHEQLRARHQRVRRGVPRPRRRGGRRAAREAARRGRGRVRVPRREEHAAAPGGGGSSVEALATHFKGPTAVAFSFGDPAKLAKILVDYAKDQRALQDARRRSSTGRRSARPRSRTLATLPSLDELRGKLVGLLQAPAGQLARLLAAPGAQIARVVGGAPHAARGSVRGAAELIPAVGAASRDRRRIGPTTDRRHSTSQGEVWKMSWLISTPSSISSRASP